MSGRDFDLTLGGKGEKRQNSPSLDRIQPPLGYVEGNLRFVCTHVNIAMSNYGLEDFLTLCKDVLTYRGVSP